MFLKGVPTHHQSFLPGALPSLNYILAGEKVRNRDNDADEHVLLSSIMLCYCALSYLSSLQTKKGNSWKTTKSCFEKFLSSSYVCGYSAIFSFIALYTLGFFFYPIKNNLKGLRHIFVLISTSHGGAVKPSF